MAHLVTHNIVVVANMEIQTLVDRHLTHSSSSPHVLKLIVMPTMTVPVHSLALLPITSSLSVLLFQLGASLNL